MGISTTVSGGVLYLFVSELLLPIATSARSCGTLIWLLFSAVSCYYYGISDGDRKSQGNARRFTQNACIGKRKLTPVAGA